MKRREWRAKVFRLTNFFFLSLFIFPLLCSSQLNKANKLFDQKQYEKAIKFYLKEYNTHQTPEAIVKLAHSYRFIQNYEQAEIFYEKALKYDSIDPKIPIYYADILKINNKHNAAKEIYVVYANDKAKDYIYGFDQLKAWAEEEPTFEVENTDAINTPNSEFSPVKYSEGIAFVSDVATNSNSDDEFKMLEEPFLSVYTVNPNDTIQNKPKLFSSAINNEYHNGPISFNSQEDEAFFTRVNALKKGKKFENKPQLYSSIRKGDSWQKAEPFEHNTISHAFAHPALSADGKLLYFVSDMPGGEGGKDLYVCEKNGDTWSQPKNLGSIVNTKRDEMFPTLSNDGILFFSSNGHNGFGGLDVFSTRLVNGEYTPPVNLKKPINSSMDDFGLSFVDSAYGYFSSTRREGKGKDDIYRFKQLPPDKNQPETALKGVFLYSKLNPAVNAKLRLLDANNVEIASTFTNRLGEFEFPHLKANGEYIVVIDETDTQLTDESELFVINEKGEKVVQLSKTSKGYFVYKALPKEHVGTLKTILANDTKLLSINLFGQLFEKLPGDVIKPLEVQIVADNGEILYTAMTDEKGNFVFENLPPDLQYILKTKGGKDVEMLILNEKEGSVSSVKKDKNGGYIYELLTRDKATIERMKESDSGVSLTTSARGVFVYDNSRPASNTRLSLIDDKNTLIREVFTNEKGQFQFDNIKLYKNYTIVADAIDTLLSKETNIFIINDDGKVVERLLKEGKEYFKFQPLSKEEYNEAPALLAADFSNSIFGKAFKLLPGDIPPGMEVFLVDDDGKIVYKTITDKFGNFEFKNLPPDKTFAVKLNEQDVTFNVVLLDESGEKQQAKRNAKGDFVYERLGADKINIELLETLEANSGKLTITASMFGQVLEKLPGDIPPGMKVYLVDDNGEIVYTTIVDEFGNFEFKNLPPDKNFIVKLDAEDSKLKLMLKDLESGEMAEVKKNAKGNFEYETLPKDKISNLKKAKETDTEANLGYISFMGQAFEKLPGDIPPGMEVYLVDDNGTIIYTTIIDENGNFEFSKLPPDKHFVVKLNTKDEGFILIEKDEKGNNLNELKKNQKGDFVYEKLDSDEFVLKMIEADNTILSVKRQNNFVFAYIYYNYDDYIITNKAKDELIKLIKVMKLNPKLRVSLEAHTDSKGKEDYNLKLSQKRVRSARDFVVAKGIHSSRVMAKGFGENSPIAPNELPNGEDNPEGRAKNRRTEIKLFSE